ncbi:MAG: TetR/AcrR family transcriptional regulator [Verrucomicrobium sp.]|nr:TetR/AcrR family transcriptional regulator [Verrucomicrobium sp.]
MQVITYMSTSTTKAKGDTRARILLAAREVLAQAGWTGATTQEIARRAQVNEVTLFRHFRTKQALFEAVLLGFLKGRRQIIDWAEAEDVPLEEMLSRYAAHYRKSQKNSADLIRTLLAEYNRQPGTLRQVIEEAAAPLKADFLAYVKRRQARGEIRRDVDCAAFLDLFSGLLLAETIKPCIGKRGYSQAAYDKLRIDVLIRGVRP